MADQGMSGSGLAGDPTMGMVQGAVSPNYPLNTMQMITLDTSGAQKSSNEGMKATYSFSTAAYAAPANAIDLMLLAGSATKKIRIARVGVTGRATAAANIDLVLNKNSTLPTAGAPTVVTPTPHDSLDAASTAVVKTFAGVTTAGTFVGQLRSAQANLSAAGSGGAATGFTWEFGWTNDKMGVLNNANENFTLSVVGAVPAGTVLNFYIEYTEE